MKEIEKNSKVAVVTGASSGIGLATAKMLTSVGYKVYGIARDEFSSNEFSYYKCDVTNYEQIKAILTEIDNKENRIDALVCCAGFGISGSVESTETSRVQAIFNVNVLSVLEINKMIIPFMKKTGGRIINIGSIASEMPIPFQSYYSATKSAIICFSRALNNELKPFKISVCCVMPGDTKTGFTSARVKNEAESSSYGKRVEKSVKQMEHDEQHGMQPEDVAKVICKVILSKNPPVVKAVGFKYKLVLFLNRLLSKKLVDKILFSMYAK